MLIIVTNQKTLSLFIYFSSFFAALFLHFSALFLHFFCTLLSGGGGSDPVATSVSLRSRGLLLLSQALKYLKHFSYW
jgi:hypothetical protein